MTAIKGGFCTYEKFFYTNGIMTEEPNAEKFCDELRATTGREVELHYNGTTPIATVAVTTGEIAIATLAMGTGIYKLYTDKEKRKQMLIGALLVMSLLVAYRVHQNYEAIEQRKKASADSLSEKLITYLQASPSNNATLVLHSQGAEIGLWALERLHPSLSSRIKVIALGGKVDIPSTYAKSVINFENENDLISRYAKVVSYSTPGEKPKVITTLKTCTTLACHGVKDYMATPIVQQTIMASSRPSCTVQRSRTRVGDPVQPRQPKTRISSLHGATSSASLSKQLSHKHTKATFRESTT